MGMKIDRINPTRTESAARAISEEAVKPTSGSYSFERHMSDMSSDKYAQYVAEMVGDITEQGKRMAGKADLREFYRYREMIRKLMDEVVSNSFAFHKFRKFDSRGRNRTYAIIERVNKKLEEMMEKLLSEESDHLELLSGVDDIRGMLVDMLM